MKVRRLSVLADAYNLGLIINSTLFYSQELVWLINLPKELYGHCTSKAPQHMASLPEFLSTPATGLFPLSHSLHTV